MARSNSVTMLPGSSSLRRCPVSHKVFRTHSKPLFPCLKNAVKLKKVDDFVLFLMKALSTREKCTLTFPRISQFDDTKCAVFCDDASNQTFQSTVNLYPL